MSGPPQAKQLAAQFIPKFIKYFPDLVDTAMNAQIDLCEDDSMIVRGGRSAAHPAHPCARPRLTSSLPLWHRQIRIHAIKGFAQFCRDLPMHTAKVADVLCQLFAAGNAPHAHRGRTKTRPS